MSWLDWALSLQSSTRSCNGSHSQTEACFGEHLHLPRVGWGGIFATNPADGSRSWAEVLFKLAWILFTQILQRVSLGALECPVSHGPAETLAIWEVSGLDAWPKVMEEIFLYLCQVYFQNSYFPYKRLKFHPTRPQRSFLKVKNEQDQCLGHSLV